MIPFASITTPLGALVYYTDCAIATYADAMLKRTPKADRARFLDIAACMLGHCRTLGAPGEEIERLKDRLTNAKKLTNRKAV